MPWIPFSATTALGHIIRPDWIVREIGAGYSTLWFADRVQSIVSIEHSREWFKLLSAIVAAEKLENVDLRHDDRFMRFVREPAEESLDLLFIDGGPRTKCLEYGFPKVKPGGYLYLDNWENEEFWWGASTYLESVRTDIAAISHFIDYVPAQVGVTEGVLIRKRGYVNV